MDHLSSRRAVGGKLRRSVSGRISKIVREIIYTGMSMMDMTTHEVSRMLPKTGFETLSDILNRNKKRKGPPVIKIEDTLQSHLSALVRKVNSQGMKWMAPKRAITPTIVQNEGSMSRAFFFSSGE